MLYLLCVYFSGWLLVFNCSLVSMVMGLVGEWLLGIYCGYSSVKVLGCMGIDLFMWKMFCVVLLVFICSVIVFGYVVFCGVGMLFVYVGCVLVIVVVSIVEMVMVRCRDLWWVRVVWEEEEVRDMRNFGRLMGKCVN